MVLECEYFSLVRNISVNEVLSRKIIFVADFNLVCERGMHPNEIMIAELNISCGCATCGEKIIVSNNAIVTN